jgi:methylmalonyl-CoA mutase N-terminal domain/subunit
MASVLGGVQSMFTAAWDEPFALPTEESTTLALRTQQILAYETGVARTVDPLGGSYFVEALTDAMEAELVKIMADLESHGGMVKCIEDGYIQQLIADESATTQRKVESGERVVVGVNRYQSNEPAPDLMPPAMDEVGRKVQLDRLREVRRTRDTRAAMASLAELRRAAGTTENLMPYLVECVHAYCTVGEMTTELRDVWGEYQPSTVF